MTTKNTFVDDVEIGQNLIVTENTQTKTLNSYNIQEDDVLGNLPVIPRVKSDGDIDLGAGVNLHLNNTAGYDLRLSISDNKTLTITSGSSPSETRLIVGDMNIVDEINNLKSLV